MFRFAASSLGMACVFASEISPAARWVYRLNFGEPPAGDITEYPSALVPEHDILTAGFPCQSFSAAGAEGGLNDPRGRLFFEVVRILRERRPRAFLLENVANLVRMKRGAVFAAMLDDLRGAGYWVTFRIINTVAVAPQHRLRVYIVGFLVPAARKASGDNPVAFTWPEKLIAQKTTLCLRDILESEEDPSLLLSPSQLAMVAHRGARAIANPDGVAPTLMGSYRTSFQRFSTFLPVPLDCGTEGAKRLSEISLRFFSVRECARLQGIPDSVLFDSQDAQEQIGKRPFAPHGAYKLIGNAVCPAVVGPILEAVRDALLQAEVSEAVDYP
jgi:DNA (cytosine-5)-methyltransferase 1